ncbi:hypothetical protein B2J69_17280 [Pantoea latae]|uniref:Uncharacterized protein n=1 Tax=Pantoea latae TaxID=1964541 RepID=A0A1V9DCV8_9GAMM|nr:hypothetical protein B2J69_17280 [Pantoea latae]
MRIGVASSVVAPEVSGPVLSPTSSVTTRPLAACGACVSTVKAIGAEAALTLPAASVTVAVRLWLPSVRTGVVRLQLPSALTVAVPSSVSPSRTVTVLPGSALPLSVRVLSLVAPPAVTAAPSSLISSRSAGVVGTAVSIVMVSTADGVMLPSALVVSARKA